MQGRTWHETEVLGPDKPVYDSLFRVSLDLGASQHMAALDITVIPESQSFYTGTSEHHLMVTSGSFQKDSAKLF